MTGEFVISLDFELLWGVRDHADRKSYGQNVLGAREAVPRLLDLFERHGISATWATVGFLFCENREELIDALPKEDLWPQYKNPALSAYAYLNEVGQDEAADPYYFAPSLLRQIAKTPGQEIGTHTLSHYYGLEEGQSIVSFESDLEACLALMARKGIDTRSIVFPRNQYRQEHLDICKRHRLTAYRGSPSAWAYRSTSGSDQTLLRRGLRLLDAHSGILGPQIYEPETGGFRNVPASQFFRPCAGRLAPLHPTHVATILGGMTRAAKTACGYHLWWHPHNFGVNIAENIAALAKIIAHLHRLQGEHGMVSRSMGGQR